MGISSFVYAAETISVYGWAVDWVMGLIANYYLQSPRRSARGVPCVRVVFLTAAFIADQHHDQRPRATMVA
jgi:hypothetical protein